jgi:UDP-3-O-[3-hydroxymyristoyl] glucosamine N-acyltransferase
MIIANHKPIFIIGYHQASGTYEFVNEISKTHSCTVIEPGDFFALPNKDQYQYIACDWIDRQKKLQVINVLESQNLDLITVIHDTAILGQNPAPQIGAGTFIYAFCHIGLASSIGKHCIISPYCQIGHFSLVGNNCTLRPGVAIIDKSTVGNNCFFNARSMVANKATVCDHVELLATSTLFKDITDAGRYAGTPARRIK